MVLIVVSFCDSSSSVSCKYAWLRSIFVNRLHPESCANMSLTWGKGYWSTCSAGLTLRLWSPHSRSEPPSFITVTTGDAQSEFGTGSMIPSLSRRSISLTTASLCAKGTGLALQNLGKCSASTLMCTFGPVYAPSSSLNTIPCFRSICSSAFSVSGSNLWLTCPSASLLTLNISLHSRRICSSQFRPKSDLPFPFTTITGNQCSWFGSTLSCTETTTSATPNTVIVSPV